MTEKELGSIINKRRKQLNMSQTELATKVNLYPHTISYIENARKRVPRLKTIIKILNALDLKLVVKSADLFRDKK